ncbi:ABC transporter permease [Paenibacillus albidus]|uniref:Putative hemin transport system permease protein HrtB n=1 Tax=Paenibacillus albidus TaxID=2041023 RepID=A0A917C4S9_9BACL|nr:ABC transporter permease [Paenibacillus albidus]GGF68946.1 ABC transporter permease [Paenibacillus albidus]
MFLALREMRHAKARYLLIMVIMLLVSFLVLFVTGLAKGLAYANISAVENMPANYFVVQEDADHTFRRSQMTVQDLQTAKSVAGDANAASLAVQTSTVTAAENKLKVDVTYFAVDMEGMLAPRITEGKAVTNDQRGNVIVDRKLAESGIVVGSKLYDQATGLAWTVAGYTEDSSYSHTPVVYMNNTDWQAMRTGGGQGKTSAESVPYNVIALHGSSEQAHTITETLDQVEVITQKEAVSSIPGYSAEQSSLMMMIVFLFVISAFVLAVFFYVITIQKTSQFGILKAMGTRMSYLAWSVVGQVLLLSVVSLSISLLLTFAMNAALPDSMPFQLEPSTLILTGCLFIGTSLVGSLISVGRVAKIDALEAIGRAYA